MKDSGGPGSSMNENRKCPDCGTPLRETDAQPLCPACIFRRMSTGATTVLSDEPPVKAAMWASSADDEADTDFLSEYELLGEVGRGGMGVIYKAYQARLNRTVALKVIHAAGLAGESARRRFQSEVKVAGRLNHPNIVPVFDVGMMDGCPCFSMEFFPGGSMADWMRLADRTIEDGVRLLVKVTQAVSFAHLRGVLHRDLKPGNILMDAAGEPHVGDFGLAKELNSNSNLTHSGAVLGSPNYMSPEQAAGRSDSLTVATDIYSLGAILYELLAGRPPFVAATPLETMRLVVEQEAPRPSTVTGRTDRDLEIICLKCLDKDPGRRYATAADLSEDLERWLRHEPILARPASQSERLRKWTKRHPALAAVTATLLVVLVAGLTGVIWQWRKAEQARRNETLQLRRAEAALARSSLALAESALREGNSPAVLAALETVPSNLRDQTWNYLQGEADTSRALPETLGESLSGIQAHPGRPSVFAAMDRKRGRVILFNVREGRQLLEFAPGFTTGVSNVSYCLALSGDRIAVGRNGSGGIVVHDANDGGKILEWAAPPSQRLEFSPDGSLLMQIGRNRRGIQMWNAQDGTSRWAQKGDYHAARFTSDGRHLARYSWFEQLQLIRADDGAKVLLLADNYFQEMATDPAGQLVVGANSLGFVRGFDAADGRQRFEVQPHESLISYVAFLPGGERFLTAATLPDDRMALQCWDAHSGRLCQTLLGGSGKISDIALHPLSGELVVRSRGIQVWETISVPALRVIRCGNAHPSAAFWGSRDVLFAPGSTLSSANLQSIAEQPPKVLWRASTYDHGQPSISADGRRAAIGRYSASQPIAVLERNGDGRVEEVASLPLDKLMDYLRISPNGDRVAIVQRNFSELVMVNVSSPTQSVAFAVQDIKRFSDVAWVDGGKHLAGLVTTYASRSAPGSVEQVVLWDTATGQRIRSVTNHSVMTVACASPDGRQFVEGGMDRNIRLRDAGTLQVLREFRVHNAPLTALAWHPSRRILATASEDLVIRLWNLDDGARLEELRGPLSPPSVLSFSPDGTRLATAARDRAARIWEPRSLVERHAEE